MLSVLQLHHPHVLLETSRSSEALPTTTTNHGPSSFHPSKPRKPRKPLEFFDLPLEIRDMIWGFTLPPPRLFHILRLEAADITNDTGQQNDPGHYHYRSQLQRYNHHQNSHNNQLGEDAWDEGTSSTQSEDCRQSLPIRRIKFHRPHPPPVTTQICSESRRLALRLGFFLPAATPHPGSGFYFNPRADILYFDRGLRGSSPSAFSSLLPHENGKPAFTIPGLDRVRRVGVEWRWFMRNGSLPLDEYSSPAMRPFWIKKLACLYAYIPSMEALHYVLPMVRYQGGYPWGREPSGAYCLGASLVDLPERVTIPIESGHRCWKEVREEFVKTLGGPEMRHAWRSMFGDKGVCYPPEVEGEWLVREGLPSKLKSPSIKVFTW